jgi:hypothetical protein
MELIIGIFIVMFFVSLLIAIFTKTHCDICKIEFRKRAKKYKWEIEGKKLIICSKCKNKLENRVSNERFNEFFYSNNGSSIQTNGKFGREKIPASVKREVWQRDGGKCVECGSKERIEYDHIIPISKGGSNTVRNLQLLCERCNRSKHAKIQ